ncbi:MAG: hypothetical protein NTY64_18225, partial [Deltaproteobacteria bacterium]|nr:hypothetical protein [Deltaproteobacteria bacterium]
FRGYYAQQYQDEGTPNNKMSKFRLISTAFRGSSHQASAVSLQYSGPNSDGFVKSPSAALRFTFVVAAYFVSTPHSSGFARRVPRNAGEFFTKPSFWRLFTRSSTLILFIFESFSFPLHSCPPLRKFSFHSNSSPGPIVGRQAPPDGDFFGYLSDLLSCGKQADPIGSPEGQKSSDYQLLKQPQDHWQGEERGIYVSPDLLKFIKGYPIRVYFPRPLLNVVIIKPLQHVFEGRVLGGP